MAKLEINMRFFVIDDDKDGTEEIYLRCITQKFREFLDVAGRGKLGVELTYERPTKTRRPSERKPKTKRSLK